MENPRVGSGSAAHPSATILTKLAKFIVGSAFGKNNTLASGLLQRLGSAAPPADAAGRSIPAKIRLKFSRGMARTGLPPTTIASLWRLVESGILAERELKARVGPGGATGPHTEFLNRCFASLAHELRCLNLLDPSDKLALWSGGIAISQYAAMLGYRCLETTVAGEMFNNAKLHKDEESLWGLWDYLAREFVDQVRGSEVHVFVRNMDRKSTLLQVEVPHLLKMEKGLVIKWHVVVGESNNPTDLLALTRDGTAGRETREQQLWFDTRFNAEIALRAYIMSSDTVKDKDRWVNRYSLRKDLHVEPRERPRPPGMVR